MKQAVKMAAHSPCRNFCHEHRHHPRRTVRQRRISAGRRRRPQRRVNLLQSAHAWHDGRRFPRRRRRCRHGADADPVRLCAGHFTVGAARRPVRSPADHSGKRRAAGADAVTLRFCRLVPAVVAQQPGDRPDRHRRAGHYPRRRHAGARGQPRQNRRRGDDRAIGRHFAVARVQRRARWDICGPSIPRCGARRWRKAFCHWASALSGQRWR